MTLETTPPRPRYRNDAVFRSAELLIASAEKRQRRQRFFRGVFALAALIGGLLVSVWLLRSPGPDASLHSSDAPVTAALLRPRLLLDRAAAAFTAPKPTIAAATTDHITSITTLSDPASRSLGPHEATPSPARSVTESSAPSDRGAGLASMSDWLVFARSTAGLHLSGEIHTTTDEIIPVEFQLYLLPGRLGGSVDGAVHFPGDSAPRKTIRVSGTWFNRTIALREVDDGSPRSVFSPEGQSFVLELPLPDTNGEITGVWRGGPGRLGTLRLKIVP